MLFDLSPRYSVVRITKSKMSIILRSVTVLSVLAFVAMEAEANCVHRKMIADQIAWLRREINAGRPLQATMMTRLARLEATMASPCPQCNRAARPTTPPEPRVIEPQRPYNAYSWNDPLIKSALYQPLDESRIESEIKRLYAIPTNETQIPVLMSLLLKRYREQPITEDMRKRVMVEAKAFNTRFEQLTAKAMKGDNASSSQRMALFAVYFLYTDICEGYNLQRSHEQYDF